MKYVDLFCGIGSFHYSFKKLGWECVMACDNNKSVQDTYLANYDMTPMGDISLIDPLILPKYDILCAGFPCQPFSRCGFQKGFGDERGTMFFQVMRFVVANKPRIIILENVPNLLTHDGGNTFKVIVEQLSKSGYKVVYKILKCDEFGIPQMRKRLFIVCVSNTQSLSSTIEEIFNLETYKKQITLSSFLKKNFEKKVAYTIRCGGRNSPINDRHNWDGYLVDNKVYRLTVPDCLKLQGFDENFKICGNVKEQWKQVGNTIPTVFTLIIGQNINNLLSQQDHL